MTEQPTLIIDDCGNKRWRLLNGKLHREDGPAIEYSSGTKQWWVNGSPHCENGPALEYYNGSKSWFVNGLRHREDGPAVKQADGTKEWYINGKFIYGEYPDDNTITNR